MTHPQAAIAADRRRRGPADLAVFSRGFRPFFLLGALYAGLALPAWLVVLHAGLVLPGSLEGLSWHAHEMIFGYLAAIIAGFVLTAVPNWTGRLPVSGNGLILLVLLWLAGRIAVNLPLQPVPVLVIDTAFMLVLAAVLWREIATGRNWRNLPVCALISIFALANVLFHLEATYPALDGLGQRLALAVTALLIGLIGGRITPSFTRNWMAQLNIEPLPVPFGLFDKVTLACAALGLASWVALPDSRASGVMLLVAGALHLARLLRWRGGKTLREPIVAILHLGYAWLAAALLLLGLAAVAPTAVDGSTALHALTAGAIGTMTLAVMTRASRGHTGRELAADPSTLMIYGLVTLGAVSRVMAGLAPGGYNLLLMAGGAAWSAAFLLFVLAYGPMLLRASGR